MLSRRSIVRALSGLCVVTAGLSGLYVVTRRTIGASATAPMPKTPVTFKPPPGACDTHVHVIGDPKQFPMSPDRDYTPPPATADELKEMLRFLNFDRVVIITPDIYDTDNSATLAAIRQLGKDRARGVAWVAEGTPSKVLDSMAENGIAGIRVSLYQGRGVTAESIAKRLQAKVDLAKKHRWHLQIATPPDVIAAVEAQLASSPVSVVLDTFGWVEGGVAQLGFNAVLSLVKSGKAYIKLAEPYRLSKQGPDYSDLIPVVQALVGANPDRVLWGSGWPHVSGSAPGRGKEDVSPDLPVDSGHLLNLFAAWVPDAETRDKILVDNPARLYGF